MRVRVIMVMAKETNWESFCCIENALISRKNYLFLDLLTWPVLKITRLTKYISKKALFFILISFLWNHYQVSIVSSIHQHISLSNWKHLTRCIEYSLITVFLAFISEILFKITQSWINVYLGESSWSKWKISLWYSGVSVLDVGPCPSFRVSCWSVVLFICLLFTSWIFLVLSVVQFELCIILALHWGFMYLNNLVIICSVVQYIVGHK